MASCGSEAASVFLPTSVTSSAPIFSVWELRLPERDEDPFTFGDRGLERSHAVVQRAVPEMEPKLRELVLVDDFAREPAGARVRSGTLVQFDRAHGNIWFAQVVDGTHFISRNIVRHTPQCGKDGRTQLASQMLLQRV
jgi:hypothetical protein